MFIAVLLSGKIIARHEEIDGHKKARKIIHPAGGRFPGAYKRREGSNRPPIIVPFCGNGLGAWRSRGRNIRGQENFQPKALAIGKSSSHRIFLPKFSGIGTSQPLVAA